MMIYFYEVLSNGKIGRSTNSASIAQAEGYYDPENVSEEELVLGWDGYYYLSPDDVPDEPPITTILPTEAIIASPNGTAFRVTVEDDGTLATEEITS